MAKVRIPGLSGAVSGKIGDIVFYRLGKWGINVARMRVIPANPRTPNQEAVRHNLKTLVDIWRTGTVAGRTLYMRNLQTGNFEAKTIASTETFTQQDKDSWKGYYVSVKAGKVDGRMAFITLNLRRLAEGRVPLKRPDVEFQLAS
ncbi:MAG: hypothetical protein QXE05_04660 [Nitrososphaeria archaeon]